MDTSTIQNDTSESNNEMVLIVEKKVREDLLSLGFHFAEIEKLSFKEAWNLLQQRTLENRLKKPQVEVSFSEEEAKKDYDVLVLLFNNALKKMKEISSPEKFSEIMDVASQFSTDATLLEKYLKDNELSLKDEEKVFIDISINIKKFRARIEEIVEQVYS